MTQKVIDRLGLTERDVLDFLAKNPDFLMRHPEVCKMLMAPDRFQGREGLADDSPVVDLQHFMVGSLQREIQDLKKQGGDLAHKMRTSHDYQHRVFNAVGLLLNSSCFEHFIHNIAYELAGCLNVDIVTLNVEGKHIGLSKDKMSGVQVLPEGTVDQILGVKNDIIVEQNVTLADKALFGAVTDIIQSQALMRLKISPASPQGLLAVGSKLPEDLSVDASIQGQLLFLAHTVQSLLRLWLDLPPY